MKPVCRHCKQRPVHRPRGLCLGCYYRPGVRELYPSTSKYARRGIKATGAAGLDPEPTDALPGTPEKMAVLMRRVEGGFRLWHPLDAKIKPVISARRGAAGLVVHMIEPRPEKRPKQQDI